VALLAVAAFGVWMRLEQLGSQVLADDEWHALNFLLERPAHEALWRFGISDHSIPMTLLDGLLANTIGLSELGMRALPLACGLAALVLLPVMVHRHVGTKATLLFAALLAISPLHVYFSRYARPYAVVFLLALSALLLLERFAQERRQPLAWGFAACTALAPWFQPVALPFVLAAPASMLLFDRRLGASLAARVRSLAPQLAAAALVLAVLLGPPILADFETIRARSGHGRIADLDLAAAWRLLAGTGRDWLAPLVAAAVGVGLLTFWRDRAPLLRLLLLPSAACIATIAWTTPVAIEVPIVAVRYVLPVLGVLLLFAACGLERIDAWLSSIAPARWPLHLPSATACVLLAACGPLLSLHDERNAVYRRPNDWMHHGLYQYQYEAADRAQWMAETIRPAHSSRFYQQIARELRKNPAAALHLVEAPWNLAWDASPFVLHQGLHRARTSIGFVHRRGEPRPWAELPWDDRRFRFANFVHVADIDELRRRGVTHVVLHRDLAAELPVEHARIGADIGPLVEELRTKLGPPCHEDELLVAFDLRAGS